MKIFTNKNLIELMNCGYTKIQLLNSDEIKLVTSELEMLQTNIDYCQKGLTYPSKGHLKKQSLIVMVSYEKNHQLPSTNDIGPILKDIIQYNSDILSRVTGISVPNDSRYMINYRKYLGETDPVFEHFDGEYLDGFIDETNYHFFNEALLPRFVSLITLDGGGKSEGAILTNVISGEEVSPDCEIGEMVIFDNVKFKHHVPKLIKPRVLLGIRNFDFLPYHYTLEPIDGYVSLGDKINYGYIKPIGCETAKKLIIKKLNKDDN